MTQDYDFLNNYISGLVNPSIPDEQTLEDDSDLYEITPENDEQSQDIGDYGIDSEEDEQQFQNDSTPYEYIDPFESNHSYANMGEGEIPTTPGALGHSISSIESGGKYTARNKHSSATGKYQFLWSAWGDSIKKVTGVSSKDEFLHSPKAQEKYYAWYEKNYLMPQVDKLRKYNSQGLSDQQLAKLVHFRGAIGARKYLQGKLKDKQESYNIPISQYIGTASNSNKHQTGGYKIGGIASTNAQRYIGLNDNRYDSMFFPMEGENEFRGLDDGTPVYLEDEEGKNKILKGRKQKIKMKGKVYEKRLN